jgi:hypothetical protein
MDQVDHDWQGPYMWRLAYNYESLARALRPRKLTCHDDFALTGALLQLAGTEHQTSKEYRIGGTVPSYCQTQIGPAKVQLGFRGV